MKVLKFGGSSLATPERVRNVSRIILDAARRERIVVVVSAFQGVTNMLLEAAHLAEQGDDTYRTRLNVLMQRHRSAARTLLTAREARTTGRSIGTLLHELGNALDGIRLLQHCPPRALDLVASFGERLSATIIAAFLRRKHPALPLDARSCVITDDAFTQASVDFERTNPSIVACVKALRKGRPSVIPVVTGFIGATPDGRTTTIGRNGSDYTASIVGAALGASVIEIWTDVDGVLSADPGAVPSAFVLPRMTYEEAMELSYFGARVIHSATIAPAVAQKIPVLIKNTLNPDAPGTTIASTAGSWDGVAKGITSVDNITLLTLRGLSMVGVPGTAERLFRSLASHRVNVILISQASSEHTICFAVQTTAAREARHAIATEFRYELSHGVTALDERTGQTIVAVVGEGMRGTPGVSGSVFNALGNANINISAIAQGASERNISFVVGEHQRDRALNVIHEAFFEKRKHLALVVLGVGNIGRALLRQLDERKTELKRRGFEITVSGIADSKRFLIDPAGIPYAGWEDRLRISPHRTDMRTIAEHVRSLSVPHVALVDCTASPAVVDAYPLFIEVNMHIITPNKKANVLPWQRYERLLALLAKRQRSFLFEANVGAGLPIISTLKDLIDSGDRVRKIEGILSGTLSFLFNAFDGSRPFSSLVREAHKFGFTEPDPRDDLSGTDVARKLLILGRQLDLRINLGDVRVENLVPRRARGGRFTPAMFPALTAADASLRRAHAAATKRGMVLRYVGVLEHGKASAGIREYARDHPFASTRGSDNVIVFTTDRYARTPLVVQGPGAGADVTAMGVFSDILKLLHGLPY